MEKKKMHRDPMLVYVNPYLGFFLSSPMVREFLDHKLDSKQWQGYTNDLSDLVQFFKEGTYDEISVLNGISIEQFRGSMEGGIHVNPALLGIMMDSNRWADILSDMPDDTQIKFINIPYELYKKVAQEKAVDKHEYDGQNSTLETILKRFPTYTSTTIH